MSEEPDRTCPGGSRRAPRALFGALLALMFLSGFAGLVYEVVWARLFAPTLGMTATALTTVIATFMVGLGLGAHWGGKLCRRYRNLLALYGWLEIGIALCGLAMPIVVPALTPVYHLIHRSVQGSGLGTNVVRVLLTGLILLPPTVLMGITLPVLVEGAKSWGRGVGALTGALYGLNTLGAVGGALAAGFFLLPEWGIRQSSWGAAGLNLVVGMGAWVLSRFVPASGRDEVQAGSLPDSSPLIEPGADTQRAARKAMLLLGSVGLCGFCALGLEVAWIRALHMFWAGSAYAFPTVLAVYLCGLGLGGAAVSVMPFLVRRASGWLAGIQVAVAVLGFASWPVLLGGPTIIKEFFGGIIADPWGDLILSQLVVAVVTLLPPTMLIGVAFPLATESLHRFRAGFGRSVSGVYTAVIVGNVAGTVVTGFLLTPLIGTVWTIRTLVGLNLIGAAGLCHVAGARRRVIVMVGLLAVLSVTVPNLMPDVIPAVARRTDLGEVEWFTEDPSGTTMLTRIGSVRYVYVNTSHQSDTSEGTICANYSVAHAACMLHPNPKTGLMIGLGAGLTVQGMMAHELEELDVVEISRGVTEAARRLSEYNGGVLDDPRVRLIVDDGRNFVATTDKKYDLIVQNPIYPHHHLAGNLFSVEYYRQCVQALKPGGLFCAWMPEDLPPPSLRQMLDTFRLVFPYHQIWYQFGCVLSVGSLDPLPIGSEVIRDNWNSRPQARRLIERCNCFTVERYLNSFVCDEKTLESWGPPDLALFDDRPVVEFLRAVEGPEWTPQNAEMLRGLWEASREQSGSRAGR